MVVVTPAGYIPLETPACSYAIFRSHSDGKITVTIRNDTSEAVAWVRERVRAYLEATERIESL